MGILISLWWFAIIWTFSEAFSRPFDDWKNMLLYIGAGLLIILVPKQKQASSAARFAIFGYFALCILSIILAPTAKYEGLLELARLILWAGLAWVFTQLDLKQWRLLMQLAVISAALIGILTWFQTRGAHIWPYNGYFLAPIGHISYYSDFMAVSLVMAIGLFLQEKIKSAGSIVWLICTLLIDLGLALSATRASLVGVFAAIAIAVLFAGWATRSAKKVTAVAVIGVVNLIVIFSLPVTSLHGASASDRFKQASTISAAEIDTASSGRWHTYVTSAHITMERPLTGWGLGSFRFVYPEFAHRDTTDSLVTTSVWYYHPHNEVLHQSLELGIPAVILFLLGFTYLLYIGLRSIRGLATENQILVITAMCGLVAAFTSWQFSTNFLFPVSRLMTAFFAGIILHQSPLGSRYLMGQASHKSLIRYRLPNGVIVTIVAIVTLFIAAYQLSIHYVALEQRSRIPTEAQRLAGQAARWAPGAFDPMFVRASILLRTDPAHAAASVESLYNNYPYVPAVLHIMGALRLQQGKPDEARSLLQHAVANDPTNTAAKQLLDSITPPH